MHVAQFMVEEFHRRFGVHVGTVPQIPDQATKDLRVALIQEEFDEFKDALAKDDIVSVADGLADMLYVIYGAASSFGIDMEPIFSEVHRSNMSKVGGYRREDGKWVKPATYSPADLPPLLNAQGWGAH